VLEDDVVSWMAPGSVNGRGCCLFVDKSVTCSSAMAPGTEMASNGLLLCDLSTGLFRLLFPCAIVGAALDRSPPFLA